MSLDQLRRLLPLSIVAALLLSQYIVLFNVYLSNYLPSDGYKLANGNLVGGDYVTFFQAGQMIHSQPERLYDFQYYAERQREFYSQHGATGGALVFAYPPLIAHLFGLLPDGSLLQGYLSWTVLSVSLFLCSIVLVMRSINAPPRAILGALMLSVGFYSFSFSCIGAGQTSAIGAMIFTLVYLALGKRWDFVAGLMLSLSYYKPPLFLAAVFVLLFSRNFRAFVGFALGGLALLSLTVFVYGWGNFLIYLSSVSHYRYGQPLVGGVSLPTEKGIGLLAAIESLGIMPSSLAQGVLLVGMLFASFKVGSLWRGVQELGADQDDGLKDIGSERWMLSFSVAVSMSLLFSIQMVSYDLAILFPFLVASGYTIIRSDRLSRAALIFICSFGLLFYEEFIRSVSLLGVEIKLTTIVWLVMTVALWGYVGQLQRTASKNPQGTFFRI